MASGHWIRWICDTCPVLDMCHVSNVSNDTGHWTETKPYLKKKPYTFGPWEISIMFL